MSASVRLEGVAELESYWRNEVLGDVRQAMRDAVREALKQGVGHAKEHAEFQNRTGNLRATISYALRTFRNEVMGALTSPMPYARYVDEGTARSRAYPYLRPATEHAWRMLPWILERELGARLKR